MQLIGLLLLVCVVLAGLRVALVIGAILILLTFAIGIVFRPAETFTWMLGFTLLAIIQAYPIAGLIGIGILVVFAWLDRNR